MPPSKTRYDYAAAVGMRYQRSSREQKGWILDEFCAATGYNRKYAIKLLRGPSPRAALPPGHGRPAMYGPEDAALLRMCWEIADHVCSKVVEAYKRDKTIKPTFRPHGAMTYDERIMSWKGLEHVSLLALDGRHLVACRFGPYQQARRDRLRGQADLILRDGAFYLCATLELAEVPTIDVDDFLGVDLGIVNIATDSDATVYTGARVEQQRRTFVHCRRNLQRRQTRSAKRKLQSLRRKQARFQRDSNHCISKALVRTAKDTGRGIALEQLQGIRERVSVRRRQRARHANWAFAQLSTFVQYKAASVGVPVMLVDPRHTSQTCLVRGHVDRANRPSQARFECLVCAFAGPADAVAACVIAARARAAVMWPNVDQPVCKVAEWEHGSATPATSRLL